MIQANKMYLYGTESEVVTVTDHQPLCALYNSTHRNLPTRVARHLSKLGGFNFKVVYEPGSTTPSDYASRHPAKAKNYSKEEKEVMVRLKCWPVMIFQGLTAPPAAVSTAPTPGARQTPCPPTASTALVLS